MLFLSIGRLGGLFAHRYSFFPKEERRPLRRETPCLPRREEKRPLRRETPCFLRKRERGLCAERLPASLRREKSLCAETLPASLRRETTLRRETPASLRRGERLCAERLPAFLGERKPLRRVLPPYPPWYMHPPTTPWYMHPVPLRVHHRPAHYRVHCSTVADVQHGNTLGSRRRFTLGGSLSDTSCAQECEEWYARLRIVTPLFRVLTDERSDSDRVYSHVWPLGRHICAESSLFPVIPCYP